MDELASSLGAALSGRFTIERELGRGGMAIVYLARDERYGRRVALKVLRPELAASLAGERFLREIVLAATLEHPHILPLHESGEAAGALYYVMPFVEGESLRARLTRERRLAVRDALVIAREVADALQYAHERNVVHRDIKPENILLSGGHARLADFGIARAIAEAGGLKLTEPGMAIGTPEYMSPEQWVSDPEVDGRADVYALGCVLYEMLAGAPPFIGTTPHSVMLAQSLESPRSLGELRDDVPEWVEGALTRALAKDPLARFASAGALNKALSSGMNDVPEPPLSRRLTVAASAAALVAVAAFGLGALGRSSWAGDRRTASIAVAPLRNLGDTTDSYFADGLAQQITAALTRVPGIAPRPFVSVSEAARASSDPLQLGRRLGVDYVLSATLRRQGDRLRITSELIQVEDGSAVWAPQSFDGSDADVFRMQDSITVRLVRELSGRFGIGKLDHGRGRSDPEAYQLLLKANSLQWTAESWRTRKALLERAVEIDPDFADAWAALAGGYSGWGQVSGDPPWELAANAAKAADRALALDSLNSGAWRALATLSMQRMDWDAALRQSVRSIELEPSSASAHNSHAKLLGMLALDDSAIAENERAIALDPRDSHFLMIRGYLLMRGGRLRESAEALDSAAALNPDDWVVPLMRSRLATMKGDTASAIRHAEHASAMQGGSDPFTLQALAAVHGAFGMRQAAQEIVGRLTRIAQDRYVEHAWFALSRFAAGDSVGALKDLEQSANSRELDFFIAVEDLYSRLHGEPRYDEVVRRAGLDRYWRGRRERIHSPWR